MNTIKSKLKKAWVRTKELLGRFKLLLGTIFVGSMVLASPAFLVPPGDPPVDMDAHAIERGWNRDTIVYADGRDSISSITTNQQNYLNDIGTDEWLDMNDLPVAVTGGWEVNEYPMKLFYPTLSTGIAKVINDSKFRLSDKSTTTEVPLTATIKAIGVTEVTGQLKFGVLSVPGGFREDADYVVYEDAFGSGIDLIYYAFNGASPYLAKLIRFDSKPTVFDYSFDICYSDKVVILPDQAIGKGINIAVQARGLQRGLSIVKMQIWENASSTGDYRRKKEYIDSDMQPLGQDCYRLTKHLPDTNDPFWDEATYPVNTDAFFTQSPDGDPETTTVDGYCQEDTGAGSSWVAALDATSCFEKLDTGTNFAFAQSRERSGFADRFYITRSILGFDLSDITDSDIVSSTSVKIDISVLEDPSTDGYGVIATSSPDSSTSLVLADYESFGGATHNIGSTAISETRDLTSDLINNQYNSWLFNTQGVSEVQDAVTNDTTTFISFRERYDFTRTQIADNISNNYDADFAEGTNPPKMIVEHAPAPVPGGHVRRRAIIVSYLQMIIPRAQAFFK